MQELIKVQEMILEESLHFLRNDKSKIVYSTCSIFPEENIIQVARFCEKHNFKLEDGSKFQTLPTSKGMDGFFSATLIPN
jgi:16S rRNA C967 or C1407 C5-methylase (RsmB/RsmF family)